MGEELTNPFTIHYNRTLTTIFEEDQSSYCSKTLDFLGL